MSKEQNSVYNPNLNQLRINDSVVDIKINNNRINNNEDNRNVDKNKYLNKKAVYDDFNIGDINYEEDQIHNYLKRSSINGRGKIISQSNSFQCSTHTLVNLDQSNHLFTPNHNLYECIQEHVACNAEVSVKLPKTFVINTQKVKVLYDHENKEQSVLDKHCVVELKQNFGKSLLIPDEKDFIDIEKSETKSKLSPELWDSIVNVIDRAVVKLEDTISGRVLNEIRNSTIHTHKFNEEYDIENAKSVYEVVPQEIGVQCILIDNIKKSDTVKDKEIFLTKKKLDTTVSLTRLKSGSGDVKDSNYSEEIVSPRFTFSTLPPMRFCLENSNVIGGAISVILLSFLLYGTAALMWYN